MKNIIVVIALIVFSQYTLAENKIETPIFYLGTGINVNTVSDITTNNSFGGNILIGYEFNKEFGVELRHSTSFTNIETFRLEESYALYGKYKYEINEETNVHFLLGASSLDTSNIELNQFFNESSISAGIGIDYKLSENISFFTDYTYLSENISQVSIGIKYYLDHKKTDFKEEELKANKIEKKIEEEEVKSKLKSKLKMNILHADDMAKPITVYLFQVSSLENFRRLDYWEIVEGVIDVGEADILYKSKEFLEPGKLSTLKFILEDEAKYFIVVAALSNTDIDNVDKWRYIKEIKLHETTKVNIMIDYKNIVGMEDK